ncbi:MAG: hypothetical protein IKG01_09435, partial [Lachnospiraceae bacterium]|nr:hypothetical protein [Lachnospiraceae bacterium]
VIHMDDQLKTLQSWINESSYTVAVTGAGVSVTAGIPDMQHMNIVSTLQMMSETILKAAPGRYYKGVYKGFLKAVYENGPTETHRKLAQLESVGKLQGMKPIIQPDFHGRSGLMQTPMKAEKPRKQAISGHFWADRTYRGRIKDDHKIDLRIGTAHLLKKRLLHFINLHDILWLSAR